MAGGREGIVLAETHAGAADALARRGPASGSRSGQQRDSGSAPRVTSFWSPVSASWLKAA